jgi:hypothetical protein
LDLGLDTRAQKPREALSYTNNSLPFSLQLDLANDYEYLAGLSQSEHLMLASVSTSHFLQEHKNEWSLQPQVSYLMTDYPGYLFTEFGPGLALIYSNISRKIDEQISPESGGWIKLGYNYFLPGWGNTSYQNINASGAAYLAGGILPKRHAIKLRGAAWISPPQNTILTGSRQGGGDLTSPFYQQTFIVRGYPYGEFIGSTLLNAGIEYRFPLGYPYSGSDTFPFFAEKWHGAIVADAITLDGGYYDNQTQPSTLLSTKLGTYYLGMGAEIKGDFQLFYFLPITLRAGYYYGFNTKAFGGSTVLLGFGSSL